MISRYGIFCKIIENGSFTKTAELLGYSQSAVSQTVKALEQETGTTLIDRRKDGTLLTADGAAFLPYFQQIYQAEEALERKEREMRGLENSVIQIGTFTSVSRNLLPELMMEFKKKYSGTRFVLQQGEYTNIAGWVRDGSIDFGFVNAEAVPGMEVSVLYRDEMVAVLPEGHPLAGQKDVSLAELGREPFILLDEGEYSVPERAFAKLQIEPRIEYKVYDDYSILAMIREGLGVSILYRLVLEGFEEGVELRPIREKLERPVALLWRSWETMPFAARRFASFVKEACAGREKPV